MLNLDMNNSCRDVMQGIIETIADFGFRIGDLILNKINEIISFLMHGIAKIVEIYTITSLL
jgi:hypothetical protein